MTVDTHAEFEKLASAYLVQRDLPIEWRRVHDPVGGNRTDLLIFPGTEQEMFASLRDTQITIGDGENAEDFEDFGRGLSDQQLAKDAFRALECLLKRRLDGDA